MFFSEQPVSKKENYSHLLSLVGALSKLFSDSLTPYLYYRIAEIAFCRAFSADDLSRSDVAVDAAVNSMGIGLKTFIYRQGNSLEKVAEFNRNRELYKDFINNPKELARVISELRNARIEYALNLHNLEKAIYHWVARKPGEFLIYEQHMDMVDIPNINKVIFNRNTVKFNDGINEYSFNISKSTLFKRFITPATAYTIPITIIDEPFDLLEKTLSMFNLTPLEEKICYNDSIMLPLYSYNNSRGKYVPEKSSLNQWNASGRKRHKDELYIRIPAWIHTLFPDFFPSRHINFHLHLPDGKILSAKICQENGKALMSNPNKELGHWLLRDVLHLSEGTIVTYDILSRIGIDTVEVTKVDDLNFKLNFKATGTFDDFEEKFKTMNF